MATIVHQPNPVVSSPFSWQKRLSPWQQFRRDPSTFLVRWIYRHRPETHTHASTSTPSISVVCISDTQCTQPEIPDGDVLLHAGDLTNRGTFAEFQAQLDWINTLPHRHKVVIAGNHDALLDPEYVKRHPDRIYQGEGTARADLAWGSIIYLNHSSTQLRFSGDGGSHRQLKIYGSPWSEQFGTWAFQYPPIRDVWTSTVPDDTDVLLVQGPPKDYLDLEGKGCPNLLKEVRRVRPRLVVFGHIHAGHGREEVVWDRGVESAYGAAMVGSARWSAVMAATGWIVWEWAMAILCLPPRKRRNAAVGTLVNAAMLAGKDNTPQDPTVVCL